MTFEDRVASVRLVGSQFIINTNILQALEALVAERADARFSPYAPLPPGAAGPVSAAIRAEPKSYSHWGLHA